MREKAGVEADVLFNPITTDAIALHRAGGWEHAGFADGSAVNEYFHVAAQMRAAERKAEGGFAMGSLGHFERDRPGAGADVFLADVFARRSVWVLVVLTDHSDVAGFDAGRLNVIPIATPSTFTHDEVDVVRKFFRIIEVEAPLPVTIAVPELAGGAVGDADLKDGFAEAGGSPAEFAEGLLF